VLLLLGFYRGNKRTRCHVLGFQVWWYTWTWVSRNLSWKCCSSLVSRLFSFSLRIFKLFLPFLVIISICNYYYYYAILVGTIWLIKVLLRKKFFHFGWTAMLKGKKGEKLCLVGWILIITRASTHMFLWLIRGIGRLDSIIFSLFVQFSLPFYNLLFFCSVTCFPNSQFDMGDLLIGTETTGNYTKLTAHA